MAVRPRRKEWGRELLLACWNADGLRGRKLELEHFLSQHDVEICILSETFLNPGQTFRLANFACHRTDRMTAGGNTAILIRRGIVHHSVPVAGLTYLRGTALQVKLARRSLKIIAAYLSPSHPLLGADLTPVSAGGGGLPVLLACDLNAKHVDWESRLNTKQGKLLRDFADDNSSLIFGPETPTNNPFNRSATPDFLNIVIAKEHPFPVYMTSCTELCSEHLPLIIECACRSSFQHPPDRSDFRRIDWANFQTHLEYQIPFDLELHNRMAIDT